MRADLAGDHGSRAGRGMKGRFNLPGDGTLMRAIFFLMLAGVALVLWLDYRELRALVPPELPLAGRPLPSLAPGGDDSSMPEVTTDTAALRKPMQILLEAGGILRLTGTITPGTGIRFAEEVARIGEYVKEVRLDSPGGSVTDAIAMSRLIRERGLDTRVAAGTLCSSSCQIVFGGRRSRIAENKGTIGVHQVLPVALDPARRIDGARESQAETATISRHLQEMGIDPAVWLHALDTPPEQLYFLSPEEMSRYRLSTPQPAAARRAVNG